MYLIDLADAVVEALNEAPSGQFALEFEAERVLYPEREYSGVTDLKVDVFARSVERTRNTRLTLRKDPEIVVIIARKINAITEPTDPDKLDALDEMLEFCDEVADYLALHAPFGDDSIPILNVEIDPIFDFEVLRTHRVFVSSLRCTFAHMP